jgi:hypothetical protein
VITTSSAYNNPLQFPRHRLQVRAVVAAAVGIAAYVVFMATVAMLLYFGRWQETPMDIGLQGY